MRHNRTRASDATFDLNLAPVLDIIVSIVPMLLLSVAFVQVKMIEAPTPQVVAQENVKPDPNQKPEVTVALRVSKVSGFKFEVTENGKTQTVNISLNAQKEFDYEGLLESAKQVKKSHPDIFKLNLVPESDVAFNDLVAVMDKVRMLPKAQVDEPVSISEAAKAKPVDNTYLFPDIVFASIGG